MPQSRIKPPSTALVLLLLNHVSILITYEIFFNKILISAFKHCDVYVARLNTLTLCSVIKFFKDRLMRTMYISFKHRKCSMSADMG